MRNALKHPQQRNGFTIVIGIQIVVTNSIEIIKSASAYKFNA
jgi:hypothetical protein